MFIFLLIIVMSKKIVLECKIDNIDMNNERISKKYDSKLNWKIKGLDMNCSSVLECFHQIHQNIENKKKKHYVCYDATLNGIVYVNKHIYNIKYHNHLFIVTKSNQKEPRYKCYNIKQLIKLICFDYEEKNSRKKDKHKTNTNIKIGRAHV